ncbi:MAG: hypothetical protein ACP5P2_03575 [Candidatus Micrarchaeia archaeon]
MEEDSFVAKIAHRLIRKHIAGNMMSSAIKKAKALNAKGLAASITFLSEAPKDSSKSNYITTTYVQLIREISRLGLKASVHVPIEQLGSNLSKENALSNAKKLVEFGNKYGVFIWFEGEDSELLRKLSSFKGVGIACKGAENAMKYAKNGKVDIIKVVCSSKKAEEKELNAIKELSKKAKVVLLAQNDFIAEKLAKGDGYKKSLVFEFQLGYSEKRLSKWMKKGAIVSVFIPFGRDWISYIINNMPQGYIQSIATSLLVEKKSGGNGKKRGEK